MQCSTPVFLLWWSPRLRPGPGRGFPSAKKWNILMRYWATFAKKWRGTFWCNKLLLTWKCGKQRPTLPGRVPVSGSDTWNATNSRTCYCLVRESTDRLGATSLTASKQLLDGIIQWIYLQSIFIEKHVTKYKYKIHHLSTLASDGTIVWAPVWSPIWVSLVPVFASLVPVWVSLGRGNSWRFALTEGLLQNTILSKFTLIWVQKTYF